MKILATLAALLLVIFGIAMTLPFALSQWEAWSLTHNGEVAIARLVEVKAVESKIFDTPEPTDKSGKLIDTGVDKLVPGEKREPSQVYGGKAVYEVNGVAYPIIRPQIAYDAKLGDTYRVRYWTSDPSHALFEDMPFPTGFLISTLALLFISLFGAYFLMSYAYKKREPDTDGEL